MRIALEFNFRFIRMSSPNMNNLIIVGSMLVYASVILLGLDTRVLSYHAYEILCTVTIYILYHTCIWASLRDVKERGVKITTMGSDTDNGPHVWIIEFWDSLWYQYEIVYTFCFLCHTKNSNLNLTIL